MTIRNSLIQDILSKRSLIQELVIKDLKIRYSRPMLGFIWSFLSPFLTALVFYVVFSLILKVKIEEAPFLLYLMSAVFPWRFFQDSLMSSTTCLMDNKNLIRESNFPHFLIPISIILANMVNFLPSLLILIIISFFILKGFPIFIIFFPFVLAIHLIITIGLSVMLSTLYVKWRDTKYILEIVLLLLLYLTPAFYSIYLVKTTFPPVLFKAYIYNPFVCLLNLYRITLFKGFYSFIQKDIGILSLIFVPVAFAVVFLFLGFYFYRRNKGIINDYLSY